MQTCVKHCRMQNVCYQVGACAKIFEVSLKKIYKKRHDFRKNLQNNDFRRGDFFDAVNNDFFRFFCYGSGVVKR